MIWESSNLLLLIPAVIGLLVAEGTDSFHKAGLALSDRPSTEKVFSLHNLIVKVLVQYSDCSNKTTDQKLLGP
jgi:hypothetical protein